MRDRERPAFSFDVEPAFLKLDLRVGWESLSVAGETGVAGSSHGVTVAVSTGGIGAFDLAGAVLRPEFHLDVDG